MKRFGNVPVSPVRGPKELKRLWRMTQEAVDNGTSLIIFPEAKRTRDGHVGEFEDGGFRLAQQLGIPIVPVSLVGSLAHLRTGDWMLRPATITVYLHDSIETEDLRKEDVPTLKQRVRKIIADPVEASLAPRAEAPAVPSPEAALKD
jgi:1-acyl-sn-glycerol-3-phosphate acyltransferase